MKRKEPAMTKSNVPVYNGTLRNHSIRAQFPDVPILATGGPNEKTILETIRAGANAITYSPPSNGELFANIMQKYRGKL